MANTLKGWLADNTVTADPNDKILVLESTGKADINKVYEEMLNEDTGLRIETIVHVTTLYERICARLLMNGWQLNTGLFYAVPRFTGVVESGKWNPEKNSIYVAFNQDKVIREENNRPYSGRKGGRDVYPRSGRPQNRSERRYRYPGPQPLRTGREPQGYRRQGRCGRHLHQYRIEKRHYTRKRYDRHQQTVGVDLAGAGRPAGR